MIDVLGGARGLGVVRSVTAKIHRLDGSVEKRTLYRQPQPLLWVAIAILVLALGLLLPRLFGFAGLLGATLLVQGGRAIITNLLSGIGGTVPKYVAWGTGAGTTGTSDTTLFTESAEARTSGTVTRTTTSTSNDTMTVTGTIVASAGRVITNAGLFDASTVGNLLLKTDFTSITLGTGESIAFTFTVQFA